MLTLPATGRHREIPARLRRTATPPRHRRVAALASRPRIPARRSPYAREQATLIDGSRSRLARPYLAGPPSSPATQRKRRRALWLATAVGVDTDHRNIHTAVPVTAGGVR
ncbi:hypothetical protein [Streptomyces exfoliatus]|uniref:hypothetical protein n=1 Tax=Streptomyces exfoliatus TaxID=1905 RepID=UPI0004B640DD|nr:hypothetical protein [Streptomyces exfoliatus]